jgi:phage I-like protein
MMKTKNKIPSNERRSQTAATNLKFEISNAPRALVAFVNEIRIGADGWAMICPLGDYESPALMPDGKGGFKTETAIQRIDRRAVEQMAARFGNSRKGLKKYLRGVPIYVGHPDVPGLETRYPDKEPKGVFAEVQAREDGLYGLPVFTNEGSELVEKKVYRAFSGNIGSAEPDGQKEGVPIYRPTELFSAGLTNNPHLPVQYLNEGGSTAGQGRTASQPQNTMKKKLIAILAKAGITLAEDADDSATEAALDQFGPRAEAGLAFANEKQIIESKIRDLEADKARLAGELDAAKAGFANERGAHTKTLLDVGINTGRISGAERTLWESRLAVEAAFANEAKALLGLQPKLKTVHETAGRKLENVDIENPATRRQFLNEAIQSVCKEKGLDPVKDYDKAFNIVQKTHGAFFANMARPELPARTRGK